MKRKAEQICGTYFVKIVKFVKFDVDATCR